MARLAGFEPASFSPRDLNPRWTGVTVPNARPGYTIGAKILEVISNEVIPNIKILFS